MAHRRFSHNSMQVHVSLTLASYRKNGPTVLRRVMEHHESLHQVAGFGTRVSRETIRREVLQFFAQEG